MSHHVMVSLPDRRELIVDYRQPIVQVMRRVNARLATGQPGTLEDYAVLGRWLDAHPDLVCTMIQVRDGTCTHPDATPDHVRLPAYRDPGPDGTLW